MGQDAGDELVQVDLCWTMTRTEAQYWQSEAELLGTTPDMLARLCALGNLAYQLRRRGAPGDVVDGLEECLRQWAGALGMVVVERGEDVAPVQFAAVQRPAAPGEGR